MPFNSVVERDAHLKAQAWRNEQREREEKARKDKAAKEWEEREKSLEDHRAKETAERKSALAAECTALGVTPELLAVLKGLQAQIDECKIKLGLKAVPWADSPRSLDEFGRSLRDMALINSIGKDMPAPGGAQ